MAPNASSQTGTLTCKPPSTFATSAPEKNRKGGGLLTSVRNQCPREESNFRTWFRKPLLYPLSYEGMSYKYTRIRDGDSGKPKAIVNHKKLVLKHG